ncbi:MAG: hypothetical protein WD425_03110 [Nitrospirales bacterium]
MSDENLREVFRALREAQTRYSYFLLAASGAAIGLAVSQTQSATLGWFETPLGLAVLMWGLSFFMGCRHLAYVSSTLYANAELLQVESGSHPELGQHPQMIAAASEGIRQAIESNSEHSNQLGHWQFRFLILGGLLYIVWHVGQMYLRTVLPAG